MTNIAIILVEPQMGENIGAAARAMKNFGLHDLRIVSPRDGWPNAAAVSVSAGASDLIENATIYSSLKDSIDNLDYVLAATASRRSLNKDCILSYDVHADISACSSFSKIGILFGRESSGLSNDEISFANKIVTINTDPNFSSLNIAQSICVICYEIYKAKKVYRQDLGINSILATNGEREIFFNHLFSALENSNFFKSDSSKKSMMTILRNIFMKIENLSSSELNALHGLVSLVSKDNTKSFASKSSRNKET